MAIKGKFSSVHLFTILTYCFAEGNMAFASSNHLPFAGGGRQSRLQLGFRNKGVSLLNLSIWSSERRSQGEEEVKVSDTPKSKITKFA